MLNVFSEVNFEYIIVGVIFAILYLIWSMGIKPSIQKKEIKKVLDDLANKNKYNIITTGKTSHDFILESNDSKYKKIYIKVSAVPRVSTITINSKSTWNLHYGGSNQPGKGFPYNRFMDELKPFLNMKVEDDELKLILVYKETLKVQKYLNESEIEIVNIKDKVYDYKIINFEDLAGHFEDL